MLVSTTNVIEGRPAKDYLGVVTGEVIVGVALANGRAVLLRYTAGQLETLPLSWGSSGVVDHRSDLGTLVLAPLNNVVRLAVWKGDTTQTLLSVGDDLGGQKLEVIFGGGYGPNGEIYVMARVSDASVVTAQIAPERRVLFRTGDRVNFKAPQTLMGFAGNAKSGPVQLMAGGGWGNTSIFQVNGNALAPVISVGDVMGRNSVFSGGNPVSYSRTAGGRTYTLVPWVGGSRDFGISRLKDDGSPEMVYPFNLRIDNVDYYMPYRLLANDRGDLLWQTGTSRNDQRIVLTRDGAHQTLLTNNGDPATPTVVDGLRVFAIDNLVLDEGGRVLAQVRVRERPNTSILGWDGNGWREVLTLGQDVTPRSELVLIALSGGRAFTTTLDFAIFNDNEEPFSAQYTFQCWERVPLPAISGVFDQDFLAMATAQDPKAARRAVRGTTVRIVRRASSTGLTCI